MIAMTFSVLPSAILAIRPATADLVNLLRQRAERLRVASAPTVSRRTLRERFPCAGDAVSAVIAARATFARVAAPRSSCSNPEVPSGSQGSPTSR